MSNEPSIVAALSADGDAQRAGDAGAETFERYRWQAKMALIAWLECLSTATDRPLAVVCEFLEDIVLCHAEHYVFAQLKTRDRGSWSDKKICEDKGAMSSLCRTHKALQSRSLIVEARFELRLEGAAAATRSTATFFDDPRSAGKDLRKKIVSFGVAKSLLDGFLGSVGIKPNQPSRSHIDAVILQLIGALWPSMSQPDCQSLFRQLLSKVELAQEGNHTPSTKLSAETEASLTRLSEDPGATLEGKVLTADELVELTPPLQHSTTDEILARAAQSGVSALELKLRAAGAQEKTVQKALDLRAVSEIRRQEVLANDEGGEKLRRLDDALLGLADSVAEQAALLAGSNPSIAARPGEWIFNHLASNPQSLQAIDADRVFSGRHDYVLGYLGHLSDSCLYPWRSRA